MKQSGSTKKHRGLLILGIVFLAGFVYSIGSLLLSRYALMVSHYETEAPVTETVRIVHLTDNHNAEFGRDNIRLLKKVKKEQPDLIVLTGDIINRGTPDVTSSIRLMDALAEIAPVYVSYGNHEKEHEALYGSDFMSMWEGIHLLNNTWEDIEIKGQKLRIGGFYGYMPSAANPMTPDYVFMDLFCRVPEDTVKILLCHMPASFLEWGALDCWDCGIVFAGHAHGGQIRLPLIGGLTAPDQGWFPGRLCGLYRGEEKDTVLVLSRGLGAGEHLPRFHNLPEIVVCDLVPKS